MAMADCLDSAVGAECLALGLLLGTHDGRT